MDKRETQELLTAIDLAQSQGLRAAIASVVRVRGSAYRREGAKMLVREDGAQACMLSGGCLEGEVAEEAQHAIRNQQTIVRAYDLEEDTVWGLGLGCGGAVDIRIEPLDKTSSIMQTWLACLRQRKTAVLATVLEHEDSSAPAQRFLLHEGGTLGALEPQALHNGALRVAHGIQNALYPRAETRTLHGQDVFFDVCAPAPQLVLFGAGHDAVPLSRLALRNGFDVQVVDARPAFANPTLFPDAHITIAHPEQFVGRVVLGPRSWVIVMNHHLERDQASLRFALGSDCAYIGVLGPRQRFEKFALEAHTDLRRVYNPIGLDIGAESPDEVAVSVLAELLALRRGFKAGFLRDRNGKIHDPAGDAASI